MAFARLRLVYLRRDRSVRDGDAFKGGHALKGMDLLLLLGEEMWRCAGGGGGFDALGIWRRSRSVRADVSEGAVKNKTRQYDGYDKTRDRESKHARIPARSSPLSPPAAQTEIRQGNLRHRERHTLQSLVDSPVHITRPRRGLAGLLLAHLWSTLGKRASLH